MKVEPSGWYDLCLHARLNREFCARLCGGSLSVAQELGRFSAEQDFRLYSWLFRFVRPYSMIRDMNAWWRRGDETRYVTTDVRGDELLVRLSDWGVVEPALCQRLLGYLGRMLEFSGPVTMLEHCRCRAHGAPACDFRFRWRLQGVESAHRRTLSAAELFQAVLELGQHQNVDELSEAIVDLLLEGLPCNHVRLWVRHTDDGEPELVGEGGEGSLGGIVHCAVLETGGHAVGRIEVGFSPDKAGDRDDLLEGLLPAIAAAIESARREGSGRLGDTNENSPGRGADAADGFEMRLATARETWRLTAREAEVVSLLARGRSNKEIAAELRVEEVTVDSHLARIRAKARVDSSRLLLAKFWSGC